MEISIIVPVYNVEQYIEQCILSLLSQTFKYFEIIIVNDGTQDKSIDKIQYLIDRNDNIRLVNQENAGLSAARNTGLRYAKGKYVCFIDSDDWVEPNFLESLYTVAEKNNLDIVCTGYQKKYQNVDKNPDFRERSKELVSQGVLSGEDALMYQYRNSEYRMEVWDDLYSRQFLLDNGLIFREGCLHEDEIFTPIAMIKAKKVQFIEGTSYCYRQREDSIMSGTKDKKRSENFYIVAQEIISYIDLVKNVELKKYFAINAKGFYTKSLILGNKSKLTKEQRTKISYNLGGEMKTKDVFILNAPKLAIMLFNFKRVIRYAKK